MRHALPSYRITALVIAALASFLLTFYLYRSAWSPRTSGIPHVVSDYVEAVYARDFARAYDLISNQDRQRKDRATYVKEQGAFSGFAATLSRRLAGFIEVTPGQPLSSPDHARVKVSLKLPDVDKLAEHLFAWDEERLNSLSPGEQNALLEKVEKWHKAGSLPFISVEEDFQLIRQNDGWRIFLNWNSPVRVKILTQITAGAPLAVEATKREILFQPGEPFTVAVKIRNPSNREVRGRAAHFVEPELMAKYLGLANCGSFVPFRLRPGREQESSATFLVWTDMPPEIKEFKMIYKFEVDG